MNDVTDAEADTEAGAEGAAGEGGRNSGAITVDCGSCLFLARECRNCVVSAVVGTTGPLDFGTEELRALSLLADAGMVPPLRYAVA